MQIARQKASSRQLALRRADDHAVALVSQAGHKQATKGECMASASGPEAELSNPALVHEALFQALDLLKKFDAERVQSITEKLKRAAVDNGSLLGGFADLIHQNHDNLPILLANRLVDDCFRATASWLHQKVRTGSEMVEGDFQMIYGTHQGCEETTEWLRHSGRSVDDVLVALMLPNKASKELVKLGASAEQGRFPSKILQCMNKFQGSHAFVVGFAGSSCWLLLVFHCTHSLFLDKRMC